MMNAWRYSRLAAFAAAVLWSTVAAAQSAQITPVSGPSALSRLGLTIQHTSMGWTGHWGPPQESVAPPARPAAVSPGDTSRAGTLTGADIYRLDCRACHKTDGSGAPPEINSLIEPVQGTSLMLWEERMKRAGRTIDKAFARQVVSGARMDLLKRLSQGGQKMPPFAFLRDDEREALLAYLEAIAGVPSSTRKQRTAAESPVRVGEHIVKGTCHICHDAVGAWPDPEALLNNAVPSLASLTKHRTLDQVVQKVRRGMPVVMGVAQVPYRGRMPVFDYLTDEEVETAYLYLLAYPPQ